MHPHSGIATLTWLIEGDTLYEDTTGEQGVLRAVAPPIDARCARASGRSAGGRKRLLAN